MLEVLHLPQVPQIRGPMPIADLLHIENLTFSHVELAVVSDVWFKLTVGHGKITRLECAAVLREELGIKTS